MEYAGFWRRLGAFVIDLVAYAIMGGVFNLFLTIILFIFLSAQGASSGQTLDPARITQYFSSLSFYIWLLYTTILWLYFAMLESSKFQATFGKMALGIKVTDMSGARISFGRATIRFLSRYISVAVFFIGFIMAGFTKNKQALHDIIAGTLVVKK